MINFYFVSLLLGENLLKRREEIIEKKKPNFLDQEGDADNDEIEAKKIKTVGLSF